MLIIMNAKGLSRNSPRAVQNDYIKSGAANVIYMLCGVLVSRGAVLGELAPFGASYAAAVPKNICCRH